MMMKQVVSFINKQEMVDHHHNQDGPHDLTIIPIIHHQKELSSSSPSVSSRSAGAAICVADSSSLQMASPPATYSTMYDLHVSQCGNTRLFFPHVPPKWCDEIDQLNKKISVHFLPYSIAAHQLATLEDRFLQDIVHMHCCRKMYVCMGCIMTGRNIPVRPLIRQRMCCTAQPEEEVCVCTCTCTCTYTQSVTHDAGSRRKRRASRAFTATRGLTMKSSTST